MAFMGPDFSVDPIVSCDDQIIEVQPRQPNHVRTEFEVVDNIRATSGGQDERVSACIPIQSIQNYAKMNVTSPIVP